MTRQPLGHTTHPVAFAVIVSPALAACESTTEPTTRKPPPPRPVAQLVVGTWVQNNSSGQAQYLHLAEDGTAAIWGGHQSVSSLDDLTFDRTWKIKDGTTNDVEIEDFGVLTYDRTHDVLLDSSGEAYRRTQLGTF